MKSEFVYVNTGEIRVLTGSGKLRALLGSCIGLAFLWKKNGVYGLAHCLLPEGHEMDPAHSGKFVSQAIPSLLRKMNVSEAEAHEIEVVVAGGGDMSGGATLIQGLQIGDMNIAAAKKYLQQIKCRVIQIEVGGTQGRQITIDADLGTVTIHQLEK